MQKKFFVLLFLTGGLGLLDACCGDDRPFIDYDALFLSNTMINTPGVGTTNFEIYVSLASVRFLAESASGPYFNTTAPLYGNSCPDEGRDGLKNPVVDVEITADQPFSDTLPAGSSLKSMFLWSYGTGGFEEFPFPPLAFEYGTLHSLVLQVKDRPQYLGTYTYLFTVTLIQADGRKVSAVTPEVIFF